MENFCSFFLVGICIVVGQLCTTEASVGDRSQFFANCMKGCKSNNCTQDGYGFQWHVERSLVNDLLLWSCQDECIYHCMWKTTNIFVARQWSIPQFYGKWPFKRLFGIQEPASVFFSILNLIVHWKMIRKFRREVRCDSPMYYIWNIFSLICMNGWVCSIVFHTRDFPLTELLDYGFAYSMVLANFCCMILRLLHWTSAKVKTFIALLSLVFFVNHFAYLSNGRFDYSYNMKANVVTGLATGVCWVVWYFSQRKKKPYAWKIMLFQVLVGISLLLELNDFSPLFWTFDAHSLWHLSTVFPTILLYSFLIDDTNYLRHTKYAHLDLDDDKEKLI